MRIGLRRRVGNAFLIALILVGGVTLACRYATDYVASAKEHFTEELLGSSRVIQSLVSISITRYPPSWLPWGKIISISREHNASVLKDVFEVFDPSLRTFLISVPIVLDYSADTAKAYPTRGYIGVSPDWDNTVLQSRYRAIYEQRGMKSDDPVFTYRFKTDLLIHEFLHMLQVHLGIDSRLFFENVARWYIDTRYGMPSPNGVLHADTMNVGNPRVLAINRTKYVLWYALYNYRRLNDLPLDESWKDMRYVERYQYEEKGVEEFAYIGQEIVSSAGGSAEHIQTGRWSNQDWKIKKMRLLELSPGVIAVFRGVFNPELMPQYLFLDNPSFTPYNP